jgi:glutaryl-CoA dehydrogenase
MLADLTAMQLYCLQIGRLAQAGRLTPTAAGAGQDAQHQQGPPDRRRRARRDSARLAGPAAHGRPGTIDTFERTETVQTLIIRRDITGIGAFCIAELSRIWNKGGSASLPGHLCPAELARRAPPCGR